MPHDALILGGSYAGLSAAQQLVQAGRLAGIAMEQPVPGLPYAVDVSVVLPSGAKVAVEADGPSHFSANCDRQGLPLGKETATVLRDRLLQLSGWRVVSVPHWEWDRSKQAQLQLLAGKLGV